MDAKRLVFYFVQGSLLPFILFVEGLVASYYFVKEDFSAGFLLMLIGFVTYAAHNILGKSLSKPSYFNEYLEDMGQFLIFGVTLIIFGLVYHEFDPFLLAALFFFSISVFFSLDVQQENLLNANFIGDYYEGMILCNCKMFSFP